LERSAACEELRVANIPALRSLRLLAERWADLDRPWGPGGSIGFELATDRHVARAESDLDVVIYADTPMEVAEARRLSDLTSNGFPTAVDVRVETPVCGFSLIEYATRSPSPILLRVVSAVVLGTDPWSQSDIGDATHVAARRT
jgi:phosphoribosyl-dephospho-CoA transferase